MTTPTIVSGTVSTVAELNKDETWLRGWLSERPVRLGLGELEIADGSADDDERSFVATDDDRCFSVDVQLGEMDASRGFGVLDNWARNRVRHPDKAHVAVLVTEVVSDRYRTTLETLAEHLPLVVVELQVWKGEKEAIVVPHVALSSDEVDLSDTPAGQAAEAVIPSAVAADPAEATGADDGEPVTEAEPTAAYDEPDPASAEPTEVEVPENKDDTGVGNPWGLQEEPEADATSDSLLTKVS